MTTMQEEISAGLKEAFKSSPVDNEGQEFQNIINPDFVAPEVTTEAVKTTPTETKGTTETAAVKSWDEQFSEKTGGKFKTWEEVSAILDAPKDEYDDEIKHLAELKKSGVNFDNDFWEVKTKDYENLKDPIAILKEAMRWKPEYKGWSKEEIEYEIKQKYKQSEWAEEGDEPTEVETIMSKRMNRDAENDKQWLIEKKASYLSVKKPDEAAIALQQKQVEQYQQNWEKYVDEEVASKIAKLSVKLSDNESFDFEVSDSNKKEMADMMKQMPKDISVFWDMFKDSKGQIDQKAVGEMILWYKERHNIVKIAHKTALAKGAEKEFKTIKNTSFKANESSSTKNSDWRERAIKSIEKHL